MQNSTEQFSADIILAMIFQTAITNGCKANEGYLFSACSEFYIFIWPRDRIIVIREAKTMHDPAKKRYCDFKWRQYKVVWKIRLSIAEMYALLISKGINSKVAQPTSLTLNG